MHAIELFDVLVTLSLVLVECTAGLEQRLVDTATTCNNTDSSTAAARDRLLRAGRKTDTGLVLIGRVADDSRVVAGRAGERTTVTSLLLNVANDRTLRALRDGEDVADRKLRLLAGVDEGTGVEALGGDESLLAELVAVGVAEDDTGKRSTTVRRSVYCCSGSRICDYAPASVVNDLLYDTLDVAIALRKVKGAELRRGLVVVGVGFELYITERCTR